MRFLKFGIKLLLLLVILLFIFIVAFISIGYHEASKPVTYQPEIEEDRFVPKQPENYKIKLVRPSYLLYVDSTAGITIKTRQGENILNNVIYYAEFEGYGEHWGLDNISLKLTNDSTILIEGNGASDVTVQIVLSVDQVLSKVDFNIKTIYKKETTVRREALVAQFGMKASEIYLKNRKVDVEPFDSAYWLNHEGVRFGKGNRSALIYNTPYLSSLQLNTVRNILIANLDYYMDHPLGYIPFHQEVPIKTQISFADMQDNRGKSKDRIKAPKNRKKVEFIDRSAVVYKEGYEKNNKFSIYLGTLPKVVPRLMLVPNGYLAGYVFTEHADGGKLRTHRAAYFGSEDIEKSEDAIGGFVKYKIPTTKSVYYSDIYFQQDSLNQNDSTRLKLIDFLNQLNSRGYDICLHTPEPGNSNREMLEESIKFMKNNFDAKTWIDHGMYSGKINRETIICDGLDSTSNYYAADLWAKYDTRYFWSAAVELIRNYSLKENILAFRIKDTSMNFWKRYLSPTDLNKMSFYDAFTKLIKYYSYKEELNSLLPNRGNAYPTPLYWKNYTHSNNFYFWTTDFVKGTTNQSSQKVNHEKELLNKLLTDRGVFIEHGYYVRYRIGDNNLTLSEGKLVVNPYYNEVLSIIAKMRDDGNLFVTTIKDLLNYWILTEKISFEYMPDGLIKIYNDSDEPINGLSFIIRANSVRINNEFPRFRKVGEDIVFWFNMPAKQCIYLEVVN